VRVAVRLRPRARADRFDAIVPLADGVPVLLVSVAAPPVDNRANEALLRLMAKEWDLARRDLAIVGGQKNRNKLVHVAGDPGVLRPRLTAALAVLPRKN
jgi:uncharacterized protein YggU (UPF0235/DUF167 family)